MYVFTEGQNLFWIFLHSKVIDNFYGLDQHIEDLIGADPTFYDLGKKYNYVEIINKIVFINIFSRYL